MKIWKVDYFTIYDKTDLEDKLNGMQLNGKKIHTVLYNSHLNTHEIIYTVEDIGLDD